jgi:hypothetical protein
LNALCDSMLEELGAESSHNRVLDRTSRDILVTQRDIARNLVFHLRESEKITHFGVNGRELRKNDRS